MAVKHTVLPRWATNDVIDPTTLLNNVIEPAEAKKDIGWNYIEKPSRQYFNWLGRQTNQWLDYLNDSVNMFAPHETDPATMAISLNAGRINLGTDVLSVAAQDTGVMTAPTTNPRIDRIVISETTGVASIIAGVEAASPTAPAFTPDQIPIAQILLYVGMTEIVNDDITDERSNTPFSDLIADDLYLIKPDSTGIGAFFQNSTTGSTATDGFFVGIDSDEKALLWNYENTDLLFATNNTLRGKIAADGKWLISNDGADITPAFTFVIYESAAGSQSYIQFITDGTGATSADGLLIGLDPTERAVIRNREATDLLFHTSDTLRGKIAASGNWLISPAGTDITPAEDLVVYSRVASGESLVQFVNSTTGVLNSDGFIVGINAAEQAMLWNYENSDLRFATNNTFRGKIAAVSGQWLISPDGTDLTPDSDAGLLIYRNSDNHAGIRFKNLATGTGVSDGVFIYSEASTKNLILRNYESAGVLFFSNNLETARVQQSASGAEVLSVGKGIIENWASSQAAFQIGGNASLWSAQAEGASGQVNLSNNIYYDGSYKYISTDEASDYYQQSGLHIWRSAAAGTADTAVTWTEVMRTGLSSNGAKILSVGKSAFYSWDVNFPVFQIGGLTSLMAGGSTTAGTPFYLNQNVYSDGVSWRRQIADESSQYEQSNGQHVFRTAVSGAADGAIAWNERVRILNDGSVNVGTGLTGQGVGTLNALNGIYVNNELISKPSAVTNFTYGGYTAIHNDSSHTTTFAIDTVIGAAFESIGPTGSGATNTWTALDSVPAGAVAVIVKVTSLVQGSTLNTTYNLRMYNRKTGSIVGADTRTIFQFLEVINRSGSLESSRVSSMHIFPIDSSRRFDMLYSLTGTGDADMNLIGWII